LFSQKAGFSFNASALSRVRKLFLQLIGDATIHVSVESTASKANQSLLSSSIVHKIASTYRVQEQGLEVPATTFLCG
jgi:hypothetical protein